VTYTSPEIATFGLSERDLEKRGAVYDKLLVSFEDDDRAIVDDYREGKMILFVSKKGTLLGGSMVAQNAGELFQELVLANSAGLNVKSIFNKTYPYPTATRINKKIISDLFSKKLTDRNKKILQFMYGRF
jgi:Pyruvate/2-oxoglutarate dehydrogenase complex, dihydrolipoamide dehydrogenase (E3) component, and related enzymes